MDADLNFCLKRFADEQMADSIKQIAQLERNLERKRTKIKETTQEDDTAICQQENELVQQFSHNLIENNIAINKTRQIIEDLFQEALNHIRNDIDAIAQVSLTTNNNQQNNEEIRTASNKIRQQIARIDSELTHIFNMIDYNNSINCSSRIISWFRQRYGYVNELNRIVGKNASSGDLLVFSENSPLMQCIWDRARLWHSRRKLITNFNDQKDEDSPTNKHSIDSLYRITDTLSTLKFIQHYIQHRQDGRRHREEQLLRKMETELEQQRIEQQIRAIELVNALCQLSVSFTNEFQLNKRLKMVLHQSKVSKQFVPILIDHSEETAVEDLSLIIRLETDYKKWISNTCSIQQRFCLALCETLQLPTDSLKIDHVKEGSIILHIVISSLYGQSVIKQISECGKDNESSMTNVQAIQKCCAKFNSRICSIVVGKYTLPIENCLMDLKWNKIYVNSSESIDNTYWLNSFDREDKRSLCPEGWKRFGIKVVDNEAIFNAKWGLWHIAYHGTQSSYAPFILTSGLRVSTTQQHCIPGNHQTICLSPSIEYTAHPHYARPWKKVTDNGEKYRYYQLVFQCRVNPDAVDSPKPETLLYNEHKNIRIDKNFCNEELEWVIASNYGTPEYIRNNIVCYGLMVRVIDGEPKDLAASSWWTYSHHTEY